MHPNFIAGWRGRGFRCNPTYHLAAHHAAFSAGAICLILRGCGSGVAGRGAECSALFGVAGFAPEL